MANDASVFTATMIYLPARRAMSCGGDQLGEQTDLVAPFVAG